MMKILGLDPGSKATGWALLKLYKSKQAPTLLNLGEICPKGGTREGKLRDLDWALRRVTEKFEPDVVCMEDGIVWRSRTGTLALAEIRGVCVIATTRESTPFVRYNISTIKKVVTGSGKADKEEIAAVVEEMFSLPRTPTENEADAVGVALCYVEQILEKGKNGGQE